MSDFIILNNIFLVIAIFATIIYIIKMIIYFFAGGDIEIDASFDSITETDISFNFISIQSILAFLMGFGWVGFSVIKESQNAQIALIAALLSGCVLMYIAAYLMHLIKKLEKNVQVDFNTLIGKTGRTYTTFGAKAKGQIEIELNGRWSILDAYNFSDEEISAFTEIRVEKVEDSNIYITKK